MIWRPAVLRTQPQPVASCLLGDPPTAVARGAPRFHRADRDPSPRSVRRTMKSFFPMRRGEAATLAFLIAFAAFAFVPAWRTTELFGMAVFGWLIAALMLLSPALALLTFLSRRSEGARAGRDLATGPGTEPGAR